MREEAGFQGCGEFLAIVFEGLENGLEDRVQAPAGQELLDKMGDQHEMAVAFGCLGISAVHVFQSEAAVLEHVETFVFATPPESGGDGRMKVNLYSLDPADLAAGKTEWRFDGTLIRYKKAFGKSDGFNVVGSVIDVARGRKFFHVWGGDCTGRAGIYQYSVSLNTPAVTRYLMGFYESSPPTSGKQHSVGSTNKADSGDRD